MTQNEMFKKSWNLDDWFEYKFWPIYPRKVAKVAAYRIAKRKVTSPAIAEEILAGVLRHRKKWGIIELTYVPHPATFLSQERWKDEESLPFTPPSTTTMDPETERRFNARWKEIGGPK
jgi:hypothetical protein